MQTRIIETAESWQKIWLHCTDYAMMSDICYTVLSFNLRTVLCIVSAHALYPLLTIVNIL